ncbi:MAG: glycosyltransferase, partial [Planctomycetes bacterium]|nr:glycosyltransferase [Planctomycetota bacterium]
MSGRYDSALTAIFTKRPRPGEVKTRLHPVLGPGRATELAQAMLDDTVERCAASTTFRTGLWAADARDVAWFRERHP